MGMGNVDQIWDPPTGFPFSKLCIQAALFPDKKKTMWLAPAISDSMQWDQTETERFYLLISCIFLS